MDCLFEFFKRRALNPYLSLAVSIKDCQGTVVGVIAVLQTMDFVGHITDEIVHDSYGLTTPSTLSYIIHLHILDYLGPILFLPNEGLWPK